MDVDDKLFSTYISRLYTNDLIKKVELLGRYSFTLEVLIGLNFVLSQRSGISER